MQTIEVKLWDDLHMREGERVPSDVQVELTYKTRRGTRHVRLDLTDAHEEELAKLLAPWTEAGQPVDSRPTAREGFSAGSKEAKDFYRDLRAWADTVGRSAEYQPSPRDGHAGKVNYRYPRQLVEDYEAHLLSQVEKGVGELARQVS